jgi:hypothetical protein
MLILRLQGEKPVEGATALYPRRRFCFLSNNLITVMVMAREDINRNGTKTLISLISFAGRLCDEYRREG